MRRRAGEIGALAQALVVAVLFPFAHEAVAELSESDARALARLSLEDLMQVEVTTVAGIGQSRFSAPAAVTVISGEDIRRGGHKSIAEALRVVPGMFVGRVNSSSWVVGTRGLTASALTANRYLVLVDGRVAHDPLLSSTFWDELDLVLEDIERIEVIRGPGATLWGANAMNGVISVITRDARDTVGTVLRAGAGDYERGFGAVRHGAETATGAYRLWAKYARRGDFGNAQGISIEDQWSSLHGGFRLDQETRGGLVYTVQGEAYTNPTAHFAIQEPIPGQHLQTRRIEGHDDISGGHVLFRAGRDDGDGAGWSAQAYFDQTDRDNVRLGFERRAYDLDFRRWARWGERNEWIWGVQYDQSEDRIRGSASFAFDPAARTVRTTNAFVQNTTELVDDRLYGMVGTKLTHHDFVGLHAQPSARLWWMPSATQTFWTAVSRPIRVPSRLEEDGTVVFSYVDTGLIRGAPASGVIVPLALAGSDDLPVEKLLSYEVGHRIQLGPRWSIDTTLFHNDYEPLISVPPSIFGSFTAAGSGQTHGGDVAVSFRASDAWRLEGSYSYIKTRIEGPVLPFEETSSPRHQAQLRSYWDIGRDWELNAAIYHVGDIPRLSIDAYDRVDVGLTWRPSRSLELALWGQNLTMPSHREASGAEVPRSVYLQVSLSLP